MVTIAPGEVSAPAEAFRLQARLISVRAGLQIIRYVSAKDVESPPIVLIQAMPEDSPYVTLLSSKESVAFSLDAPGDAIVVRASRDVRLVTTTASLGWLGADSAVLKIERIDQRKSESGKSATSVAKVELIDGPGRRVNLAGPTSSGVMVGANFPAAAQKELVRRGGDMLAKY